MADAAVPPMNIMQPEHSELPIAPTPPVNRGMERRAPIGSKVGYMYEEMVGMKSVLPESIWRMRELHNPVVAATCVVSGEVHPDQRR